MKICYQAKTNKEMSQYDFQFFGNLMIFFSKDIDDQMFLSHVYFAHLCKFSNQKNKNVVTIVFECFQSHCHILKELHEFLCMINALTMFG